MNIEVVLLLKQKMILLGLFPILSVTWIKKLQKYIQVNPFTQTETCTEELERIITTTRTYDNGTVEKSTEKETAKNELTPTEQTIVGTHYENSCKNILSFNSNLNIDGYYDLKLDNNSIVNVYCDMTTNGGGYTAYWTEGYHLSINDFASLVESNWVQNSSQFYWHIDNQDGSNLAQVFTTFDNTHTHWFDNHTGGDGAGTVDDPNLKCYLGCYYTFIKYKYDKNWNC